jgi:hypothetical protein
MALEDLLRGRVLIRWGIRVNDPDIKDRGRASGPEPVDSDVAAELWGGLGAVGARRSHVLTGLDEGLVRDVGGGVRLAAEMYPCCHEVVVAVEDQPPFVTGHGVLRREAFATSVASGRERCGRQAKAKADDVSEFVGREVGAVKKAWQGGEPGTSRR